MWTILKMECVGLGGSVATGVGASIDELGRSRRNCGEEG